MAAMEASGWCDVYRRLHGDRRAWSWHSPQAGNGFRLDEAFANAEMFTRIRTMEYRWGTAPGDDRRHALSDHAAMLIDIDGAPA
jgi:exonuclease III